MGPAGMETPRLQASTLDVRQLGLTGAAGGTVEGMEHSLDWLSWGTLLLTGKATEEDISGKEKVEEESIRHPADYLQWGQHFSLTPLTALPLLRLSARIHISSISLFASGWRLVPLLETISALISTKPATLVALKIRLLICSRMSFWKFLHLKKAEKSFLFRSRGKLYWALKPSKKAYSILWIRSIVTSSSRDIHSVCSGVAGNHVSSTSSRSTGLTALDFRPTKTAFSGAVRSPVSFGQGYTIQAEEMGWE